MLIINQNKAARAASDTKTTYKKLIVIGEAVDLLRKLTQENDPDTRLFPVQVIPIKKLEKCIKDSAHILGWNPRFRWSLHSLRHGGMQAIKDELEQRGLSHLLPVATMVSDNVRLRYLRPNEERVRFIQQGRSVELEVPDDE
jgi:hypothetical protein